MLGEITENKPKGILQKIEGAVLGFGRAVWNWRGTVGLLLGFGSGIGITLNFPVISSTIVTWAGLAFSEIRNMVTTAVAAITRERVAIFASGGAVIGGIVYLNSGNAQGVVQISVPVPNAVKAGEKDVENEIQGAVAEAKHINAAVATSADLAIEKKEREKLDSRVKLLEEKRINDIGKNEKKFAEINEKLGLVPPMMAVAKVEDTVTSNGAASDDEQEEDDVFDPEDDEQETKQRNVLR